MGSSTDASAARFVHAHSRPTTASHLPAVERVQEATFNQDAVDMINDIQDEMKFTTDSNTRDSVENGEPPKEGEVNLQSQSVRGINSANASQISGLSPAVQHTGSHGRGPESRQLTHTQNKNGSPDGLEKRVVAMDAVHRVGSRDEKRGNARLGCEGVLAAHRMGKNPVDIDGGGGQEMWRE